MDIMSIRISGQMQMEKNYNTSVRLGMCMICMLFPLCDSGFHPFLHDISNFRVGSRQRWVFGVGRTDTTCWSALGSTPAFKIFQ